MQTQHTYRPHPRRLNNHSARNEPSTLSSNSYRVRCDSIQCRCNFKININVNSGLLNHVVLCLGSLWVIGQSLRGPYPSRSGHFGFLLGSLRNRAWIPFGSFCYHVRVSVGSFRITLGYLLGHFGITPTLPAFAYCQGCGDESCGPKFRLIMYLPFYIQGK